MRSPCALILCSALGYLAEAHNIFGILLVNGTESPEWKYVRDVARVYPDPLRPEDEFQKTIPDYDMDGANITCGRNAFDAAAKTETADVLAGSEVGFRVSWSGGEARGGIYHQGPLQAYLSRAPNDDLEHYRGDGDWFKIAWNKPTTNYHWDTWGATEWNFTIPLKTPPGRYLLRVEDFMPSHIQGQTQWYINCAHVNIIGQGGGNPSGFARFPGTYRYDDPGIWIPVNQYENGGWVKNEDMRLQDYVPPGPPVWTG
ncbi:uncharacterized protein EI97DRAFT_435397 [Westerdykella ornata]|uniref:lytic cellulose monooxygenase (C4-dehydrogenating) n=1 Tax=Westerdykella ornata TaxID=318751 RepID=A0A6A6JCR4_WESOR|nr:uncharacterized protein EI97DRAFT_435397 [Westerdykella ornata]KAF2274014.1 hypothetical protein EI97DRAFT_435397 [Westerdykella ornata]